MKFLHLADLHLGKKAYGFDMLEEQKHALAQALDLCQSQSVDGVVIAGDVYDTGIPPVDAVRLLSWFLNELQKLQLPVFLISGNHDSAGRLAFAGELLDKAGLHIASVYDGSVPFYDLEKDGVSVRLHLLPFIKPRLVKDHYDEEFKTWNDAVKKALAQVQPKEDAFNVLVSHQYFMGASLNGTETGFIGTQEGLSADLLKPFDYAALGHLHQPQKVAQENWRYCGTLTPFAINEIGKSKTLTVVEFDDDVSIQEFPVQPLYPFIRLKGTFEELTAWDYYQKINREGFFHIVLTDDVPVSNAGARLRAVYPKILVLEETAVKRIMEKEYEDNQEDSVSGLQPEELFEAFFEMQNGRSLDEESLNLLKGLWEDIHEAA